MTACIPALVVASTNIILKKSRFVLCEDTSALPSPQENQALKASNDSNEGLIPKQVA
jgi:hypothetical protein